MKKRIIPVFVLGLLLGVLSGLLCARALRGGAVAAAQQPGTDAPAQSAAVAESDAPTPALSGKTAASPTPAPAVNKTGTGSASAAGGASGDYAVGASESRDQETVVDWGVADAAQGGESGGGQAQDGAGNGSGQDGAGSGQADAGSESGSGESEQPPQDDSWGPIYAIG